MGAFPNPLQLSRWHPVYTDPVCRVCGGVASLVHMVWTCPGFGGNDRTKESWEALLLSQEGEQQKKVIRLALDAAETQGISAVA